MRRTPILLLGIALLALALPARGNIAVQLEGELTAGALSPESQAAVDDFFANDPQERDPSKFACFEGDLVDLETNRVVGIGVDCLWVFGAPEDPSPGVATIDNGEGTQIAISPQIDAVTFFFLPGGHLVSDGLTTVRPFFVGIGDGDDQVTHMTGSVPGATPTIVAGSGRFSRMVDRASVRLSGAVNTSKLFTEGKIDFRCIFVIETGP